MPGARGDADHLHRLLPGGAARRAGALPVHAAGARRRLRDARVVPPVADARADAGAPAAAGDDARRARTPGRARLGRPLQRLARPRLRPLARRATPRVLDGVLAPPAARSSVGALRRRGHRPAAASGSSASTSSPGRRRADAAARPRARRHAHRGDREPGRPGRGRDPPHHPGRRARDHQRQYRRARSPTTWPSSRPTTSAARTPRSCMQLEPEAPARRADYMARIRARAAARASPASQLYFHAGRHRQPGLNFGLSAPIDVQVEGTRPRDGARDRARAARRSRARCRAPPTCASRRCSTTRRCSSTSTASGRRSSASASATSRTSLLTSLARRARWSPRLLVNPQEQRELHRGGADADRSMASVDDLLGTPLTPGGGTAAAEHHGNVRRRPGPLPLAPAARRAGERALPRQHRALSPTQDRASVNHYTVQPCRRAGATSKAATWAASSSDIQRADRRGCKLPPGTRIHVRGQSESMRTSFEQPRPRPGRSPSCSSTC